MGHFVTWWAYVRRKNLWSCMASKKKFSPISFFRLHNKANGCERETQRENLNIERWVCACFYTCFTVVLSRSRSNGFRLVLPIPKVWVFNVLLISSHWLLHLSAKEILSGALGFLQEYQMLMAAQQHTWGMGMATWSFGWSGITRGIGSRWRIWSFFFNLY